MTLPHPKSYRPSCFEVPGLPAAVYDDVVGKECIWCQSLCLRRGLLDYNGTIGLCAVLLSWVTLLGYGGMYANIGCAMTCTYLGATTNRFRRPS